VTATPITVTVVGDKTTPLVIAELRRQGINSVSTIDQQSESSVIIVVQDSTVGPMPIHLEIAKSLEKRPAKAFVWVFTNSTKVGDQELLELEELECREIFNSQGLPGDHVIFGFDSSSALVSPTYNCPRGWTAIVQHIRNAAQ
jgi:translation elongation factor EF-Tu-like GTPase